MNDVKMAYRARQLLVDSLHRADPKDIDAIAWAVKLITLEGIRLSELCASVSRPERQCVSTRSWTRAEETELIEICNKVSGSWTSATTIGNIGADMMSHFPTRSVHSITGKMYRLGILPRNKAKSQNELGLF